MLEVNSSLQQADIMDHIDYRVAGKMGVRKSLCTPNKLSVAAKVVWLNA